MEYVDYIAMKSRLFAGSFWETLPHAPGIPDYSFCPERFVACPWKNNGSPGNRAELQRPDPEWHGSQAGNRSAPKCAWTSVIYFWNVKRLSLIIDCRTWS